MRTTIGYPASGFLEAPANFAFDAVSNSATTGSLPSATPVTWTHTPVGIPRGIIVLFAIENSAITRISDISYGGVLMTECALSPFHVTPGSNGGMVGAFFLGSGIPTGARTITANLSFITGYGSINFASISLVGPNNCTVEDTTTADTTGANPTAALTINEESFCAGVCLSAWDTTADLAVSAGHTQITEIDVGSEVVSFAYRTTLPTTNSSVTWTAASAPYGVFAIAVHN